MEGHQNGKQRNREYSYCCVIQIRQKNAVNLGGNFIYSTFSKPRWWAYLERIQWPNSQELASRNHTHCFILCFNCVFIVWSSFHIPETRTYQSNWLMHMNHLLSVDWALINIRNTLSYRRGPKTLLALPIARNFFFPSANYEFIFISVRMSWLKNSFQTGLFS